MKEDERVKTCEMSHVRMLLSSDTLIKYLPLGWNLSPRTQLSWPIYVYIKKVLEEERRGGERRRKKETKSERIKRRKKGLNIRK